MKKEAFLRVISKDCLLMMMYTMISFLSVVIVVGHSNGWMMMMIS